MKKNGKPKTLGLKDYPLLIEAGTDEYRAKKNIQVEKIDSKGVFRRSRVLDQTKFDELFLSDKINKFQYSAAEMYLNLMKISGCFLRSPSLKGGVKTGFRESANLMASKIMAISFARDCLRNLGDEYVVAVETCLAQDKDVDLNLLKTGLDALVRYFHID
jgi:hypothetical protein